MASVHDLFAAHAEAQYPSDLGGGAEIAGVSLIMLDADIAGLAAAYLGTGGTLRPDQWFTLRASAADVRAVMPQLAGESWVYFGRLYALAQAMLQAAPDAPAG
jgi:hypothetical protein